MKQAFTDRFLKALKPAPRGKRATYWDAVVPGFGVRVTDKRHVSFFVMRRRTGFARPVRVVLGPYPALSLAVARDRARDALHDLTAGIHPGERAAAERRAEETRKTNLFENVAAEFIERHASKRRTGVGIAQLVGRELIARWGRVPITAITRSDVIRMIEEITDRGTPYAAHQALIYTRRLFNWAIARDLYGLVHSPCDRLSARDLIGSPEPRQRILSDGELRLLWRATEAEPNREYPYFPYIRLLLLTGQRRSEAADATWDEFDLDGALWVIPGHRMKNNSPHEIPLSPPVVDLLRTLPRFAGGPYVFSTTAGARPISGFTKFKDRFDRRLAELSPPGIPNWRLHDLRRTMRTHLSALPISPQTAELVIGHRQRGIQRVYDLHAYAKEKREALELWAQRLSAIVAINKSDAAGLEGHNQRKRASA
jgi:integrase